MGIWYTICHKRPVEKKGAKGMERLDKRLSAAGYGRREARELIRAGRVTAAGRVVLSPEEKLPGEAVIRVDGKALDEGFVYLMLHKPAGVVSATRDGREKTVLDLLPPELGRRELFPVGRLDKDVTGLLLLTDDGALAHRLLSPRRHVDKVYRVTVAGELTQRDREALAAGLTLGDGLACLPAELELTDDPAVGLLTLREGKYHQVKRMMACLGKPVKALERVAFGGVELDPALEPGRWRALTAEEIRRLAER